ncbi:glycoside hydrolase family 13 protein [Solicola sp. PLA-1-18]|uniref:glycoside hydrolase family 13 protein n=1 Tax=Solicola sp. PLA-1-18 TaxID=3380532 RepID=UPI003B8139FE
MTDTLPSETRTDVPWWRDAVCYQIYPRSFADSTGDGVGDLPGITSRLPYLAELGVDAVWLSPFYTSPQADHGYDVADYRDVDPMFGTLADADEMLATAHGLGLKVIVDLVPNHSSAAHVWFQAALAAAPGSPERARYIFREGKGEDGSQPPNNWRSQFGGPAWTRVPDGQWYLHIFEQDQPDFDWDNPEVGDEFESVLRFWLDRGADGFRVDVAHGMVKADGLPDAAGDAEEPAEGGEMVSHHERPYWDQPGVHEIYRRWRRVLDEYDGDRMMIGEAWTADAESMAMYVRPDEMQQVFNFHWLEAEWSAAAFRQVVEDTYAAVGPVGATPTWVLSNHDVTRTVTRYGGGTVGLERAKAATLAMLAMPGSAYIWQGEELGLPQVDVAPEDRQDPMYLRGGGVGRDGCRIPVPWSGTQAPFGFGPGEGQPWLPMPAEFGALSVEAQADDPASTLSFFRAALAVRHDLVDGLDGGLRFLDRGDDVLAFARDGEPGLVCVVNCGDAPVDVADLGAPLVSSVPLDGTSLPGNAGAWFAA